MAGQWACPAETRGQMPSQRLSLPDDCSLSVTQMPVQKRPKNQENILEKSSLFLRKQEETDNPSICIFLLIRPGLGKERGGEGGREGRGRRENKWSFRHGWVKDV